LEKCSVMFTKGTRGTILGGEEGGGGRELESIMKQIVRHVKDASIWDFPGTVWGKTRGMRTGKNGKKKKTEKGKKKLKLLHSRHPSHQSRKRSAQLAKGKTIIR